MYAVPEPIATVDQRGCILDVNGAAQALFDRTRAELIGLALSELVAERARAGLDGLRETEQRTIELPIRRKDGSEIAVEVTATSLRVPGPAAMVILLRRLSERERTEEVIRQTQRYLEEGQAIAHVGSWVSGVLGPDAIWWSPETYRIFGVAEDMPITVERFFGMVHPDDREAIRAASEAALGGGAAYDVVHRVVRPDGGVRVVRERAVVVRDERGVASRMVGTAQDVTERMRVERKERFLARVSAELSQVLEYPQILDAVAKLAVPELAEAAIVELEDESGPRNAVAGALPAGGIFLRSPLQARGHEFGTVTLVRGSSAAGFDAFDQEVVAGFGLRAAFAIDNARLFHQAQQSIQARDEFLVIAGHELKTPIAPVRMQIQSTLKAIASGRPPTLERLNERLLGLDRAVGRVERLVETLLQVADLTVGRMVLSRRSHDLAEVVRDALARLASEIERAGAAVTLEASEAPTFIDAQLIGQACEGLISNALKYGAGARIDLAVRRDAGDVFFSVTDHGPGIPLDEQKRIFQRFTRRAPLEHFGGFGLGLWIAQQIAQAHAGGVDVSSRPGEGARFTLWVPAEDRRA